jgi:hypothetical protein
MILKKKDSLAWQQSVDSRYAHLLERSPVISPTTKRRGSKIELLITIRNKQKGRAISDSAFSQDDVMYELLLELPSCFPKADQTRTEKEHGRGFGHRIRRRGRRVGEREAQVVIIKWTVE